MYCNKVNLISFCVTIDKVFKYVKKAIDILMVIDYNFASLISWKVVLMCRSGCSSVWLEYLVWDQGAEGSSPFTPTTFIFF